MSKAQLALNLFLAGLSLFFLTRIANAVLGGDPVFVARISRIADTTAAVKENVGPSSPSRAVYDAIPARNLFHPDRAQPKRSDALVGVPPAASLMLYGVVGSEDNPLAYLEDPATKKIFGYKTGDKLAGGYVERIELDRVVIRRTDGHLEVMLRSPNKPRAIVSGAPPVASAATLPPNQPAPSVGDDSQGRPLRSRSRPE